MSSAAGGFKAVKYVLSVANRVGTRKLAAAVRSNNTCKACAFGTGGQRGGLHNEYSQRIEICNKNIQAQLSDIRDPIPREIFQHNTIAELQALSGKQLEDLGRLAHPLYKAADAAHYQVIDFEQAFDKIASRMQATRPERAFIYGSGRSSNEAAFILQLFARLWGCNHVNNCSYYCHQASGVGLGASIGTGTATIQYGDLHQADLVFVLGANPASNHPRFVKVLLECRQRGGQVVIINPAREAGLLRFASPSNFKSMISGGGAVASHYVQPHVGGDVALLSGLAKALLANGDHDPEFIAAYCAGFAPYRDFIEQLSWPDIEREAGVGRAEIERIAEVYAEGQRVVFAWGMGMTHHGNGTDNVQTIANLALLRGMIAGPGKGLLPLRGHSNVQGVGSMGFTPKLKDELFRAIEQEYGVELPAYEGMDTLSCVQAAEHGEVDFALLLGGNLFSANPDTAFSTRALDRIPFKVMINSTLNQTHVNGVAGENIILPIRVRDEETQATTQESMFNFVRMSDGGFDRIAGVLSEVEIICAIACRGLQDSEFDFSQFQRHADIRAAIARLVPGFEAMARLDSSKEEFHIGGRHLTEPRFDTADGKAHFAIPTLTDWQRRDNSPCKDSNEFMLTSMRIEGQFNTIIYSEEDIYRRQPHRQVLLMNAADMARLQLSEGQRVDVRNATGEMLGLEAAPFAIKAGNVMAYFPEANALIPQAVDARSRTPGFKSVLVRVSQSV
ncbi:MAG: FdhF/YdeP family oxidoreductase [Gammaproteobacteria bacterium]